MFEKSKSKASHPPARKPIHDETALVRRVDDAFGITHGGPKVPVHMPCEPTVPEDRSGTDARSSTRMPRPCKVDPTVVHGIVAYERTVLEDETIVPFHCGRGCYEPSSARLDRTSVEQGVGPTEHEVDVAPYEAILKGAAPPVGEEGVLPPKEAAPLERNVACGRLYEHGHGLETHHGGWILLPLPPGLEVVERILHHEVPEHHVSALYAEGRAVSGSEPRRHSVVVVPDDGASVADHGEVVASNDDLLPERHPLRQFNHKGAFSSFVEHDVEVA